MAEYIEREAVLLHLNDIWLSAKPTDTMYDDDRQLAAVRCMGINDAMDVVKEAPAADVGWIPVVKRLPELHDAEYLDEATGELVRYKESMPVLIWLAKGGFMDIGIYEKSDAVDDFCYQGIPHTVTYWMPLPEPPKEE